MQKFKVFSTITILFLFIATVSYGGKEPSEEPSLGSSNEENQKLIREPKEKVDESERKFKEVNGENKKLKEKNAQLRKSQKPGLTTLQQEFDRTKVELNRTKVELDRTKVELDRTKVELDRTKVELDRLKNDKQILEDENKKLNNRLNKEKFKTESDILANIKEINKKLDNIKTNKWWTVIISLCLLLLVVIIVILSKKFWSIKRGEKKEIPPANNRDLLAILNEVKNLASTKEISLANRDLLVDILNEVKKLVFFCKALEKNYEKIASSLENLNIPQKTLGKEPKKHPTDIIVDLTDKFYENLKSSGSLANEEPVLEKKENDFGRYLLKAWDNNKWLVYPRKGQDWQGTFVIGGLRAIYENAKEEKIDEAKITAAICEPTGEKDQWRVIKKGRME
jgi:hypothetical protein